MSKILPKTAAKRLVKEHLKTDPSREDQAIDEVLKIARWIRKPSPLPVEASKVRTDLKCVIKAFESARSEIDKVSFETNWALHRAGFKPNWRADLTDGIDAITEVLQEVGDQLPDGRPIKQQNRRCAELCIELFRQYRPASKKNMAEDRQAFAEEIYELVHGERVGMKNQIEEVINAQKNKKLKVNQ